MTRTRQAPPPKVMSKEECTALAHRLFGMLPGNQVKVEIDSRATAGTSFARGDTHVAQRVETIDLSIVIVNAAGQGAGVSTDRIDDVGLANLTKQAIAAAKEHRSPGRDGFLGPQIYPKPPQLYFDSTVTATAADAQAAIFRDAAAKAEAAKLVIAGDLNYELSAVAAFSTHGHVAYVPQTYGEFSMTARTKDGTGSGWGWSGFEDWSRVTVQEVIARAIDFSVRSANPVAVEPGRYTVILEPAAVAAMMQYFPNRWSAAEADGGGGPFAKQPKGTNKIGLQMLDSRLQVVSNPWDPDLPTSTTRVTQPFRDWAPLEAAATWFKDGILTNLEYPPGYAEEKNHAVVLDPRQLRLEGTGKTSTLEEMIATTKRGLWINRFSGVQEMNWNTRLLSGTTRDGAFLIENGKVTKAIKNFRFTESPLFVLNKLEAFGPPVRAARNIVAPRIKVRDFDFTSLTDAV